MEVDLVPQERGYERDVVWSGDSTGGKMVFTLLAEVITLHVESITIDVQGLSFELIPKSRSTLQGGLEERPNDSI